MNRKIRIFIIRVAVIFICAGVAAGPVLPFFAESARAATAGNVLEVRVGYFGDDKDYRTKAKLTREQLEACGAKVHYYSNVTRVGGVMGTVARGPKITDVLEAAGIDPGSVQTINLRTTDGQQVNNWFVSLNMDQWVNSTRYYYPKLRANYETEDGAAIPGSGALSGSEIVPAILAMESYATKSRTAELDPNLMDETRSYRFCTGQTAMKEKTACSDWSSMNSAYWIFGIDATLYGKASDVSKISLDLKNEKLKVGSKEKITARLKGQDLFQDKVSGKVTWSSSDTSIATVDSSGVVTIKKKGRVTITATSANGVSQSVVINGISKKKSVGKSASGSSGSESSKNSSKQTAADKKSSQVDSGTAGRSAGNGLREIVVGGSMYDRQEMAKDAVPLDQQKQDHRASGYAAAGAGVCAAGGALYRLLLYLKEVK